MTKKIRIVFGLAILITPGLAPAAVYNGRTLDGQALPATAFSDKKTKTFEVSVIFSGTDALVTYQSGRTKTLSLETETIKDPHHIRVYDYDKKVYWEINVIGLN